MPNLAAVLRADAVLKVGSDVYEYFESPHNQYFEGKITAVHNTVPKTFCVKYEDGTTIDHQDEHDVRRWFKLVGTALWVKYVGCARLPPARPQPLPAHGLPIISCPARPCHSPRLYTHPPLSRAPPAGTLRRPSPTSKIV